MKKKKYVYRLQDPTNDVLHIYEIGECDNPRSYDGWCDRRICEGFWGDEKVCQQAVKALNKK